MTVVVRMLLCLDDLFERIGTVARRRVHDKSRACIRVDRNVSRPGEHRGLMVAPKQFHVRAFDHLLAAQQDRKSTRLNSSHPSISYAVFCLKKKKIYTERYK